MSKRTQKRSSVPGRFVPWLFLVSVACSRTADGGSDGITHWLSECATDEQCDADAECVCGLCTRSCKSQSDCSGLSGARCLNAEASGCGEPLCGLSCERDGECNALGGGLFCVAGGDGQGLCARESDSIEPFNDAADSGPAPNASPERGSDASAPNAAPATAAVPEPASAPGTEPSAAATSMGSAGATMVVPATTGTVESAGGGGTASQSNPPDAGCEPDCQAPSAGGCLGCIPVATAIGNMCDADKAGIEGKPIVWDCGGTLEVSEDDWPNAMADLVQAVRESCEQLPFAYPTYCCARDFMIECLDTCEQPATGTGACAPGVPMYAFDPESYSCQPNGSTGCQGTQNLFPTQEACESRCPVPGHGEANPEAAWMYFSDAICATDVIEPEALTPRIVVPRDGEGFDQIDFFLQPGIPELDVEIDATTIASFYHRLTNDGRPTWAETHAVASGWVRFSRYELPGQHDLATGFDMPVAIEGSYAITFERVGELSGDLVIAEANVSGTTCEEDG